MSDHLVGACGKNLKGLCYPSLVDDLCIGCDFNGWIDRQEEMEIEEEIAILSEEDAREVCDSDVVLRNTLALEDRDRGEKGE